MILTEVFQQLVSDLRAVYDEREARNIAVIVLEDALGFTLPHAQGSVLNESQMQLLAGISKRLLLHEPLQYVLGQADFYGLKLKVNPHVLIPRQETEGLVYWIIQTLGNTPAEVIDIGTGSGCIAIALKKNLPAIQVTGLDISAEALSIAADNALLNQVTVSWELADICREQDWPRYAAYDLIVSNPPYILANEAVVMPDRVKQYEPHLALFVGSQDPLFFYEKIARFALRQLRRPGWLFFECSEFHARAVAQLLEKCHYTQVALEQDLQGKDRMVRALLAE